MLHIVAGRRDLIGYRRIENTVREHVRHSGSSLKARRCGNSDRKSRIPRGPRAGQVLRGDGQETFSDVMRVAPNCMNNNE